MNMKNLLITTKQRRRNKHGIGRKGLQMDIPTINKQRILNSEKSQFIDKPTKKWCFLLKRMVTKKICDINKNVTNMAVIIKGV